MRIRNPYPLIEGAWGSEIHTLVLGEHGGSEIHTPLLREHEDPKSRPSYWDSMRMRNPYPLIERTWGSEIHNLEILFMNPFIEIIIWDHFCPLDEPRHVLDKMFLHYSMLNLVTLDHGPLTLGVGSRLQSQHMLKHYQINTKITVRKIRRYFWCYDYTLFIYCYNVGSGRMGMSLSTR